MDGIFRGDKHVSYKVERKILRTTKPYQQDMSRHPTPVVTGFQPPEMVVKPEHGQCVVNRSRATVGSDLSETDARMTQRKAITLVPETGTRDHHTSI